LFVTEGLLLAHRFGRNCGIRAELETDRSRESEKHKENISSHNRASERNGMLEYWSIAIVAIKSIFSLFQCSSSGSSL
jgi:hypothetical protein